jgi:3-deoxy-D-manno-octulosonic-acid transferase
MKEKCSVCVTPTHTEKFEKIHAAIHEELKKRNIQGEDAGELAMALAILVADSLGIDVYT